MVKSPDDTCATVAVTPYITVRGKFLGTEEDGRVRVESNGQIHRGTLLSDLA